MKNEPKLPDQIEMLKADALVPYERNARTHSAEQVEQIAASIREFGWTNPVLVDASGTIVAGHGRVLAAKRLGIETVPCVRLGHLTPEQARAYVIADNKLALNAGWDDGLLRADLEALQAAGTDLGIIGFSEEEIEKLIGGAGPSEPAADVGIEYKEKFAVLVECKDEAHQAEVFEQIKALGYECKVLVN